ncbi:hypothetical protein PoB_000233000 [Plakobranchus ocellatus]|uniref:CUB domain-containing protein n=1 Tax=Plakobranchus ocellatus TaxID=259542 RepID=A0AAV3XYV5_9GAST|nr:hypothetical protein PoB_000233000 [Plakobranchus ocellatus]
MQQWFPVAYCWFVYGFSASLRLGSGDLRWPLRIFRFLQSVPGVTKEKLCGHAFTQVDASTVKDPDCQSFIYVPPESSRSIKTPTTLTPNDLCRILIVGAENSTVVLRSLYRYSVWISAQLKCNQQCSCSDILRIHNVWQNGSQSEAISACLDPSDSESEMIISAAQGGFVTLEFRRDTISQATYNVTVWSFDSSSMDTNSSFYSLSDLAKVDNSTSSELSCYRPLDYLPACFSVALPDNFTDGSGVSIATPTNFTGGSIFSVATPTKSINGSGFSAAIPANSTDRSKSSITTPVHFTRKNRFSVSTPTNSTDGRVFSVTTPTISHDGNSYSIATSIAGIDGNHTDTDLKPKHNIHHENIANPANSSVSTQTETTLIGGVVGGLSGTLLLLCLALFLAYKKYYKRKVTPGEPEYALSSSSLETEKGTSTMMGNSTGEKLAK